MVNLLDERHRRVRRVRLACRPFFAPTAGHVELEVSEIDCPTPAEETRATLDVRSGVGAVLWSRQIVLTPPQYRQSVRLPVELKLPSGKYTAGVSVLGDRVYVLQDFIITEPLFDAAAEKLKEALLLHAQAMDAARQRRPALVLGPLRRAAQLFSEAESTECAVAAWRDLAALNLGRDDLLAAREACRRGLWIALVMACDSAAQKVGGDLRATRRSQPFDLRITDLARELVKPARDLWDLLQDTAQPNDTTLGHVEQADDAEAADVKRVLVALTSLGQRDDVFQNILRSLLVNVELTDVAYRCLSAIDGDDAVQMLPEVVDVAVSHNRYSALSSTIEQVIATVNLTDLYTQLPYVTGRMSQPQQDLLLSTILRTRPIEPIIVDDTWQLFEPGRLDKPVAWVRNDDAVSSFLAPHFSSATFSDARAAIEAAI